MTIPAEREQLRRFYRWNAPIYDLTRWVILRKRREAVEALELSTGQTVVEIGCGTGWNLKRMAEKTGTRGHVIGVDLSPEMLRVARRRIKKYHARAEARGSLNNNTADNNTTINNTASSIPFYLLRTSAEQLTLAATVDAVLFSYSLTMIPRWRQALQAAWSLLTTGGRLVIVDFGCAPQAGLRRRWFERYLSQNHVDVQRDFLSVLHQLTPQCEVLFPPTCFTQLLRVCK